MLNLKFDTVIVNLKKSYFLLIGRLLGGIELWRDQAQIKLQILGMLTSSFMCELSFFKFSKERSK